jgi:DNA polymerase epsilon subunit 2
MISKHVNVDFFGAPTDVQDLISLEQGMQDDLVNLTLLTLSDIWLDQPKTFDRLRTMFEMLSEVQQLPFAIVLMGNFCSQPVLWNGQDSLQFQAGMNHLADLICEFPVFRSIHWVIVPGPNDPAFSPGLVPRDALGEWCTQRLKARLGSKLHLASNPCRIKFLTREIVIYRDDVTNRMERNSVVAWNEREHTVTAHVRFKLRELKGIR